MKKKPDVLCVGNSTYDLMLYTDHHPGPDEKCPAQSFTRCPGGPAFNAAVTSARLGCETSYAGYIGNDIFGQEQLEFLGKEGIDTELVVRGKFPTPFASGIIKPDGSRTLINFSVETPVLKTGALDFRFCRPKVVLFDGHEPHISMDMLRICREHKIPAVLDAGSVKEGTVNLFSLVDYPVISEKFLHTYSGETDEETAFQKLAAKVNTLVVTLGKRGLRWKHQGETGKMDAFKVKVVDTAGAGDVFHGAFAAGLVFGKKWNDLLKYASAAAALCCTVKGTSASVPSARDVDDFLSGSGN